MPRIAALLIVAAMVGLICMVFPRLDTLVEANSVASSDNRTWALAQLEVDFRRLESATLRAQLGDDDDLRDLSRAIDIMVSRVALIEQSEALRGLPLTHSPGWQKLAGADGLMAQLITLVDTDPGRLRQDLPALAPRMRQLAQDVHAATTLSLTEIAAESDMARQHMRNALRVFSTTLIVISGGLVLLLLAIVLQWRRQARLAHRLSHAVHSQQALIDASHDAVLLIDAKGIISNGNQVAHELLRLDRLGDVALSDHLLPQDSADLDHCWRSPTIWRHDDGAELRVEATVVSAIGAAGTEFRVAFLRDMTRQIEREQALSEALEAARQGEEAKARFVAVMSHEMRTPLAGLLSAVDSMEESARLEPDQRWLLDIMRACAQATLEQVNNVLELARLNHINSRRGANYPQSAVCVNSKLRLVMHRFHAAASHRRNRLHLHLPAEEITVKTARQLLDRVVSNLLSNAVKFTEAGDITLGLITLPGDTPDRLRCRIWVEDSGIGIAAENRQLIFANFETLDGAFSGTQAGSGLGLGIAKWAAETLNGTITVDSTPGRGSRFTFEFEAERAERTEDTTSSEPGPSLAGPALRILLAEDNEINRRLFSAQLRRLGHDVTEVDDGTRVLEIIETGEDFDIILMDVWMPHMDGITTARRLRDQARPCPPIIALTAQADQPLIDELRGAGIRHVATKPIPMARLMALVRTVAERDPLPPQRPAAGAGQTDADLVDMTLIGDIAEAMGPEFASDILARFQREMESSLPALHRQAQDGTFAQIAALAHGMAGSAAMIGFRRMHLALCHIENEARDDRLASATIKGLCALYANSLMELRDKQARPPQP